ncbi:hypothetical protein QJS10_CPB19g00736 [Acorus calamus]|uniref:Uncharacterized protein n=1 Tax=Acorus calamus TaxID=4465 RepID=A0AAV9CHS2_ACOCL|nr:hypothetical protein QJS10_CPB19g00736 [Acorus calamus]
MKPNEKHWVVVLGSGWVGCWFLNGLDTKIYVIHCETVPVRACPVSHITVGAEPLTFNINGVEELAVLLRDVSHAQEIQK